MSNHPRYDHGPRLRFVDRPDLQETFADSVQGFTFDGHTLRVVFTVTRFDEPKASATPSGRQYPTCRLVLSRDGAMELIRMAEELRKELIAHGEIAPERH